MSVPSRRVPVRPAPVSPGPPKFVRATFAFKPSVEEELTLDAGDVIKMIRIIDDFWQYGQRLNTGQKGQYPCDFVKEIILPKHSSTETLLYALDPFYPEAEGDLQFAKGDVIILESKINNEWGSGRCSGTSDRGIFPLNYTGILVKAVDKSTSTAGNQQKIANGLSCLPDAPVEGLVKAKAIMNLSAQLEEELSFTIGDEITILEETDNGTWYKGQFGKNIGTFPAAFVQLLKPMNHSGKLNGSQTTTRQNVDIQSKSWNEQTLDRDRIPQNRNPILHGSSSNHEHHQSNGIMNQDTHPRSDQSSDKNEVKETPDVPPHNDSDYNPYPVGNRGKSNAAKNTRNDISDERQNSKGKMLSSSLFKLGISLPIF